MTRKIIHVDMDCFYAAIEVRDNPALENKPVAVGGSSDRRGVLCTCNYIARQYGVRSAMATGRAYRQCPDLIVLPVNMARYKDVAQRIHAIFREFTHLVEPLALDEAYLDVSHITDYQGSATLIAQAIRERIWQKEKLTASAGVAPNKFLAKVASGWKKPNGLFVIPPHKIENFIKDLPIEKLYGVGKVNAEKLHQLGLNTCLDLQKFSLRELKDRFGRLGEQLYDRCHGIDHRNVEPNRIRKSLSVETTFTHDIKSIDEFYAALKTLHTQLEKRLKEANIDRQIKNQYVKIKYNDFKLKTAEMISHDIHFEIYWSLFQKVVAQKQTPIRLLGMGVHFENEIEFNSQQQSLF